jgi:drug/metabolite transporter (DMT)-like permease
MLIASYMVITKRKFVWNKTVLFGAVCNTAMALTFVSATKMTTAANAIVLQFTEPIFVILLMWALYKKKPKKAAVVACAVVFAGILCFFLDSLSAGGMAGNLLAVFSGFTYALVMMMKGFPGADFESSLLASHVISLSIGLPSFLGETDHSAKAWICIILLGVIQFGLSYIFLSRGLDRVSPVTASLTSTLEPILNPILVAIFCGETIGRTAVIGAVLVIGAAACYNVYEAAQFVNQ